jgi:hypothetical protein
MKSLLFQLAYQAASTVLSLFYAYKYQPGQKQHDQGQKPHLMNNFLAREDIDRGRNAFGTENPPYINLKTTENEQRSP